MRNLERLINIRKNYKIINYVESKKKKDKCHVCNEYTLVGIKNANYTTATWHITDTGKVYVILTAAREYHDVVSPYTASSSGAN
ncbi:MAG: hypothetical protein IJE89_00365 [Bacilli bacterium]|nr:hypothetical protein [Bacilli bacterium]